MCIDLCRLSAPASIAEAWCCVSATCAACAHVHFHISSVPFMISGFTMTDTISLFVVVPPRLVRDRTPELPHSPGVSRVQKGCGHSQQSYTMELTTTSPLTHWMHPPCSNNFKMCKISLYSRLNAILHKIKSLPAEASVRHRRSGTQKAIKCGNSDILRLANCLTELGTTRNASQLNPVILPSVNKKQVPRYVTL